MQLDSHDVVLVTGATGFTGSVLLRKLCRRGCRVKAITRASSDRSALNDLAVEWVVGDVFDPEVIKQATIEVNYIFHLAAAYRDVNIDDRVYEQVHIESTKLLAEAALGNSNLKRFIHVSTVGVHGHIENPPANEDTPYNPGDIYQETKAEAERWVLVCSKEHGLPVTVVRPAAIYGPGDRRLLKLFKMAKMSIVPIIGFTHGYYHLIHVEDLTQFMITVAEHESAVGRLYICGNPAPMTIKSIIKTIAQSLNRRPFFVRIPASPVFLLASLCEKFCKLGGIAPPLSPRRVAFFIKDRSFDTNRMRSEIGYQYQYTNEAGLLDTLNWYMGKKWM